MIYELVLGVWRYQINGRPVPPPGPRFYNSQGNAPLWVPRERSNFGPPPFLQVCRQIREEGQHIFYDSNPFYLRVRQGVTLASEGHLAFPLPRPFTQPLAGTPSARSVLDNIFFDTFHAGRDISRIENISVLWSHDCSFEVLQAFTDAQRPRRPLVLLNLGFSGIGWGKFEPHDSPELRIGDDTLDWDDQDKVVQAYLGAMPEYCETRPEGVVAAMRPGVSPRHVARWIFPMAAVEDLVRAMRIFKKRCPRAMNWVEVHFEIPRVVDSVPLHPTMFTHGDEDGDESGDEE